MNGDPLNATAASLYGSINEGSAFSSMQQRHSALAQSTGIRVQLHAAAAFRFGSISGVPTAAAAFRFQLLFASAQSAVLRFGSSSGVPLEVNLRRLVVVSLWPSVSERCSAALQPRNSIKPKAEIPRPSSLAASPQP